MKPQNHSVKNFFRSAQSHLRHYCSHYVCTVFFAVCFAIFYHFMIIRRLEKEKEEIRNCLNLSVSIAIHSSGQNVCYSDQYVPFWFLSLDSEDRLTVYALNYYLEQNTDQSLGKAKNEILQTIKSSLSLEDKKKELLKITRQLEQDERITTMKKKNN